METRAYTVRSQDHTVRIRNIMYLSDMVILFREQVDKFFATMDRDFDGRLTLEEFMGEETPIEKLFKLMDKNGDGFVTKKVFI